MRRLKPSRMEQRKSSVAFEGVLAGETADAFFFVVGEPVIAWHPGVMLVDFAEASDPIVVLADANADPSHEATDGNVRLVAPVADVVGDPASF
jgi:hypothetical protein